MKKITILLISLFAVVTLSYSQATDLIISEYIEGSSNNKAIEIYNGTGNPVDLSGYEVWRISNGGNWPEATQALSGTLADGDVYVIANSSSDAAILAVTDLTAGIATWNGDDAVGLAKNISGTMTLIDAIGEEGPDPGSGWDVAGVTNATANHTLVRKSTICSPNTNWATSAGTDATNSEWIVYNQDDFSYLGSHTGNCSGGNIPPSITNITQTPTVVTSSTTVSVSADVTDSDGTVAGVELHWGTTSGSLSNTINMSNTGGDTYTTDTDIPAQADGTTVYYEVYALDDDADDNTSPEQSYTVTDPATTTLPYSETFDADLGDCYTYSVSGDTKFWQYSSYGANGYADMNGYNSGETEEDWLVLPGIDFDNYSNEIMTFDTWWKYGTDDANNYMKLYYSPDYPGIGDPTSYTWTEIAYTQGASDTWASSGTLDLSGISGTSVYIAFKYHYEAGNYRHWEVDNISITPSVPVPLTFQVNMANETVSTDGVHVAGTFNGWDPAATLMTDPDGDNIYTVTITANSNTEVQFKYLNGNAWGTEETVPSSCQKPGTTNRYEYVTAPYDSIPVVCFSSCTDCGGAYYDITFQVDMQNETVSGDGVYLAGTFTNWGTNALQMTQNGTVWSTTVSLQENSPEEYKFVNGDPNSGGSWESINNRTLTVPSANTTLDLVCFNSYTACPVNDFVMINEVDADQAGTDTEEFIELYDGGLGNTSLTGLVVVLYNGNGDVSYDAIDLDGYSTNGNGYFVIGSTGMGADIDMGTGWLQNGADAVALYVGSDTDFPNGTAVTTTNIVDALVYDTNDGDDPGLLVLLNPGQPQVNEAGRGNSADHSNQRIPNGSGGLRNTDTYDQSPPTPGAENFLAFTEWTGTLDSNWDDAGNWDNGVPYDIMNATIPNVAKAAFPVISGSATCASLTMAAGSSLEISPTGALTVLGTFANNGGTLTIKSDATGTGSLIENNGVNATVERFLSQDKWHYIATPTDDVNTGVFTGLYMMYWDEPAWLWKWVLSADSTLAVDMQGYALWSDGADATVTYTGALNTGTKTINLTNTSGTPNPTDYSGFNLVGNPYPSSLNWNNDDGSGWTRTNMDMTVWVWNHTAGNYGSYVKDAATGTNGVDSILAPQQGFFVHCTTAGSLSVDNAARVHSSKDILKGGKSANGQYLMLRVDGNGYSDEIMVSQNNNSSYNFDINDGLKLYGSSEAPQLYTISSDNKELSINSIPALASSNLTIPMNFMAGANGEYTITLSDIEGFENTPLYLEDLYLGTITQITDGFVYNFKAATGDDESRFLIHFSDVETPPVNGEASMLTDVSIYSYDKTIYLFSKENVSGMVKVFDLTGKLVTQKEINETTSGMIKDSNLKGFYIVTLTTNDGIETEKVYIK